MFKRSSLIAVTALSATAFASSAVAGETMDLKPKPSTVETSASTQAPAIGALELRANPESGVLGAVERTDMIAVEGPDGRIYYNRMIPVSELPDPKLDIRVLETYTVNHEGGVYTNKVVQRVD